MSKVDSLKNICKKVTGTDSTGETVCEVLDDINENYESHTAANQANSTASDVAGLVTDFNALLAKLKAAGIMEADQD